MRNLFDQYTLPENQLTHALVSTLGHDRKLLASFLKWLNLPEIPPISELSICEQQVPGTAEIDLEEDDSRGLPDAFIFNDDGWGVLFECKVQSRVSTQQIRRHRKTAVRHGFAQPHIVIIAVDNQRRSYSKDVLALTWKDIYKWFSNKTSGSFWAGELVRYMQVFEQRMIAREYHTRGTITVFDGLKFDSEDPYNYREGKRLIRLLGDQLQCREDLKEIGVDTKGERRHAITGRGADLVWDFLPLTVARDSGSFTTHPHLTFAFHRLHAIAAITVPNGIRGGFRTKLKRVGEGGFMHLLAAIEERTRPIVVQSPKAKPTLYLSQRRYKSQRSIGLEDARIEADLRTATKSRGIAVKSQPEWLQSVYNILLQKRSNMQLGLEVRLSYSCPIVRSASAADLFAQGWVALSPLLAFVLDGELPDQSVEA